LEGLGALVPHVREQSAKVEFEIAWIARRQHGVISVEQLHAIGIDKSGVARRVRVGRLHRLHRGVYAVGHAGPSLHRDFMAAVLVSGEGAALSHGSAAVLWRFLKPLEEPIHVTSPSPSGKKRHSGIVLHRSPSLRKKGKATLRERIPVTTPRRTIEDLEGSIEPYLFRRAKRQAELKKYKLHLPNDRTRSDLESDFLRFLAKHGFPAPEVNVKVGKYTVDFLWPAQMLAVETDFFDYHRGSVAFEDDHQRELSLRRAGYTVRRYTGAQLDDYPAEIVAELGEILSGQPPRANGDRSLGRAH
jgi:very-short-patch-repair endonuclease